MSFDRLLGYLVAGVGVLLLLGLATTQAGPSTVGPDRAAAAHMLERVNEARAEHDLPPLQPADDLARVAERWSARMAQDRHMRHNPSYGDQMCCWTVATENVAWSEPHRVWRPGDPVVRITDELHEALLQSPGHRANLLDDDVDQIGIGIHVDDDGNVWITQNFRRHVDDTTRAADAG